MTTLKKGQDVRICSKCISKKSCIFSDLDNSQLRELEKIFNATFYPSGAILFTIGDEPEGVYLICAGRIKLSTFSRDGRAATADIVTAGDIIAVNALLSGKSHNIIAEVLEITQLRFIRRDHFISFLNRCPSASFRVAEKLSSKLHDAYRALNSASFKRAYERTVEFLLRTCQNQGELMSEGIRLNIEMTQEEIADEIGSSRRTITRTLRRLKEKKIISYRRHCITIHDRGALENCLRFENLF